MAKCQMAILGVRVMSSRSASRELSRIAVGRPDAHLDALAFFQRLALPFQVFLHKPKRPLYRAVKAQQLFYGRSNQGRIVAQLPPLLRGWRRSASRPEESSRVVFSWPVASSSRQLANHFVFRQQFPVAVRLKQQSHQIVSGLKPPGREQGAKICFRLADAPICGQIIGQGRLKRQILEIITGPLLEAGQIIRQAGQASG